MAARRSTDRHPEAVSPVRVLLLILAVVFTVEAAIMLLIAATVAPESRNDFEYAVLDAVVLVATLSPALWFLVVRPLRSLVNERGALLARTITVQEEERSRLARDLHDELGQVQTSILLGLRSVADAETLEQARARAKSMHEMAVEAIDATRRMARGLSPAVLADFGLGPAVERMCADVADAAAVAVVREIRVGAERFEPPIEMAAYRFVQEALTNCLRHSGATSIQVEVHRDRDRLEIRVADDGRGLPPEAERGGASGSGLGLAGMRERVTLLGGAFRVSSSPAGGTIVHGTLPAGVRGP